MSLIENPASGERIRIRTSAIDSGGTLLAWELWLAPGGRVPSGHVHPAQEERFSVVEGRLRFRVDGRSRVVGPGQSITVSPGARHHFANAGPTEAFVLVETRPALRMEELLEVAAELAKGRRRLPRPVDLMLFMDDFRAEVQSPYLGGAVRLVVRSFAQVARLVGVGAHYRRLRAGISK
jgi:mannose-6-phosphate isomerase-like protein (cupin superfamily)